MFSNPLLLAFAASAAYRFLYSIGKGGEMAHSDLKLTPGSSAEQICLALSQEQFLRPRQSIHDALTDLGICPIAVNEAVHWLELNGALAIGRLRASELMQLSRCVHRIWEQAGSSTSRIPQTT